MTLLEIKWLTHRFGCLCAISDFNLDLGEGELLGIIGPNGAGKTTVFNLITGVFRPTEGSIRFRGTDLVGRPPYEIVRLGVARTFQNIRLFGDLSVLATTRTTSATTSQNSRCRTTDCTTLMPRPPS